MHGVTARQAAAATQRASGASAVAAAGAAIRPARIRELPALARLQRRGFAFDRGYGLLTCVLLRCAPGPVLLVARDAAGRLVGMVIADRRGGRTPHGRILNLCVAPEQRRRGYGRALLAAAERAVPARTYVLMVDQKNRPAIALYEAHGYRVVGLEPDYYGRHRHAVMMQKGR